MVGCMLGCYFTVLYQRRPLLSQHQARHQGLCKKPRGLVGGVASLWVWMASTSPATGNVGTPHCDAVG